MVKRLVTSIIYDLVMIIVGCAIGFLIYKSSAEDAGTTLKWITFGARYGIFFIVAVVSFRLYPKSPTITIGDRIVEFILIGLIIGFIAICSCFYPLLGIVPKIGDYIVKYGIYIPRELFLLGFADCLARITRPGPKKPKAS